MNEQQPAISESGCQASEPFALRVLGDSMAPEFPDGSIIIIEPTTRAENGAYIIADVDGSFIFRQLCIEADGSYLLKAVNSGYPDIDISDHPNIKGIITQRAGTRRQHRKHYG